MIGWRPLLLLPDRGEKKGEEDEGEEEEESSPTGDETGSRRGLLSWLWDGEVTVACPWRAGELEDILARVEGGERVPAPKMLRSRSCAIA